MLQALFWISALAVVATYVVYPVVLLVFPKRARRRVDESLLPRVSLLISAYNEADVIREKLENSLALGYPADRLEIVVVSDGSDDGTDEIVRDYADRGVVLRRQETRAGKSLGLSRFVPMASGEVIVFSDANSMYDLQAIRLLVRHFADDAIGYVVGNQRYAPSESEAGRAESVYWGYETWLKEQESRIGSVVGGDGAITAIRAELFEPLRADDINDFYLPLRIVARGYAGVFEKEAVCYEHSTDDFGGEFRRRVRIVTRSLRAVVRVGSVLNPLRCGMFAFQLWIHKVLRWLVPFFLIGALTASSGLAQSGSPTFRSILLIQLAFYLLALLRFLPLTAKLKGVSLAYYFCMMNAAAFLGVLYCIFGGRISTWQPERTPVEKPAASTGV